MDNSYIIMLDSNCEMPHAWREEWGIKMIDMPYSLDGKELVYDFKEGDDIKNFYQRMREGETPTTMQRNSEEFKEFWRPILDEGKDILYLCFSSKLSGTYDSACMAQKEIEKDYPERKIIISDTKLMSAVVAVVARHCVEMQKQGASMEEVAQWMDANKQFGCAYFTVDDLVYLKRGGRLSGSQAFFGNMLNIKPMLYLDPEGGLTPIEKTKGRKKALRRLAEITAEKIDLNMDDEIIIIHGDCLEEAKSVEKYFLELVPGAKLSSMQYVGPVIGAHVGPGIVGVCFMGHAREKQES